MSIFFIYLQTILFDQKHYSHNMCETFPTAQIHIRGDPCGDVSDGMITIQSLKPLVEDQRLILIQYTDYI